MYLQKVFKVPKYRQWAESIESDVSAKPSDGAIRGFRCFTKRSSPEAQNKTEAGNAVVINIDATSGSKPCGSTRQAFSDPDKGEYRKSHQARGLLHRVCQGQDD